MEVDKTEVENILNEVNELKAKNAQLTTALSTSSYQGGQESNLVAIQLDTSEMKEQIEHFLKGDVIKTDKQGNEFWEKQKDEKMILFNAYGVNAIMIIIGQYIDKNTMLSKYTEERINEIMGDLGDAISIFIFCNYEKMGMTTDFKKSRFELTILTILHAIESTYRRALGGFTSEDLNQSKIGLTNNQPSMLNPVPQKKGWGLPFSR